MPIFVDAHILRTPTWWREWSVDLQSFWFRHPFSYCRRFMIPMILVQNYPFLRSNMFWLPPKYQLFFGLKLKYQICWLKLLVFLMFSGFEKTSKCKQCKCCRCLGGIPVFHDAFGTRRDFLLRDAGRVGVYASFMDVQTPQNIVPDTFWPISLLKTHGHTLVRCTLEPEMQRVRHPTAGELPLLSRSAHSKHRRFWSCGNQISSNSK